MNVAQCRKNVGICIVLIGIVDLLLFQPSALGQGEESASRVRRYKQYEVSTGYYEDYEVKPRRQVPLVGTVGVKRWLKGLSYNLSPATVRSRSFMPDSHYGVKFYEKMSCESCHVEQAHNVHSLRANITCRQCHGPEPIAGIYHYFSPMNPVRRHAYVCSKCHEGASASYAAYVIHEPSAASPTAKKGFASLYYSYWLMLILLVGTLAFFIPHSFVVGVREFFWKRKKAQEDSSHEHQTV
ncbi:MAG: hypothetical protein AB1473_16100 [Thermodesulfobacteriota bacterium]